MKKRSNNVSKMLGPVLVYIKPILASGNPANRYHMYARMRKRDTAPSCSCCSWGQTRVTLINEDFETLVCEAG